MSKVLLTDEEAFEVWQGSKRHNAAEPHELDEALCRAQAIKVLKAVWDTMDDDLYQAEFFRSDVSKFIERELAELESEGG